MDEYQAISHTTWDCKYHVVFIPKCRRKTLYLELRRHFGEVFHRLAAQKESKIEEGHLIPIPTTVREPVRRGGGAARGLGDSDKFEGVETSFPLNDQRREPPCTSYRSSIRS